MSAVVQDGERVCGDCFTWMPEADVCPDCCLHPVVEQDDNGYDRWFLVCQVCDSELVATPDGYELVH